MKLCSGGQCFDANHMKIASGTPIQPPAANARLITTRHVLLAVFSRERKQRYEKLPRLWCPIVGNVYIMLEVWQDVFWQDHHPVPDPRNHHVCCVIPARRLPLSRPADSRSNGINHFVGEPRCSCKNCKTVPLTRGIPNRCDTMFFMRKTKVVELPDATEIAKQNSALNDHVQAEQKRSKLATGRLPTLGSIKNCPKCLSQIFTTIYQPETIQRSLFKKIAIGYYRWAYYSSLR